MVGVLKVAVKTLLGLVAASLFLVQDGIQTDSRADRIKTMAGQILAAGEKEYLISCAVCHGKTGDGVMSKHLFTVQPGNLRTLLKENDGQFPYIMVINVIDGRTHALLGHGSQMMPVWGERFMTEALKDINPYTAEWVVRSRVLSLVYYLQSIQEYPEQNK